MGVAPFFFHLLFHFLFGHLQALLTAPPGPEVANASAQGVGAALVGALVETVVALRGSGLGAVPPDEARAVRNARSRFALLQP